MGKVAPWGATGPWLACPLGATCPGGKINWDTGIYTFNEITKIKFISMMIHSEP